MNRTADFSKYPLPEALARRVVTYLIVFRLFISFYLMLAFFGGLLIKAYFLDTGGVAGTFLISYVVMAIYLAIEASRPATPTFFLAKISLATDILFQSALLFMFGGAESQLAVLLIFASASAAIVFPLRLALFLASLVVLAFIGEAVIGILLRGDALTELMRAGLFGATTFLIVILVNLLSYWLRDYRLLAEQRTRELTGLEEINELIIRRMRSGVMAVDSEGQIQLMNESAWFLLGSPAVDQKDLFEIAPQLEAALTKWRKAPATQAAPLTLYPSQSRIVPKFVSLPGTEYIRVLIFLEDNEVVSQRAVEMSAHLLANLSGSIAHEIRNPLGAISHAAQLLEESEEIADADLRLVDIIHSQSGRMNGIVENILQLSRHEKSRPDIFELSPFLEKLTAESQTSLPGLRLTLNINPDERKILVLFDRSQLHQALWKLLENAVRHAHLDAAMPMVELSMKRATRTGYCIITVEDNGPGISENIMTRIFDPFFTTHKEGSGLGLYIARQLCEVNQAELTVDSIEGTRARFHIRLAVARTGEAQLALP